MIRVGIAGAGWAAEEYNLPGYLADDRAEVVAIAEMDDRRRKEVASEHSISNTFADAESMLAEETIDAISICTPPHTHESLFVAAAERGCHVFCEKPLTTTAESAERMRDAARRNGVVTQVGYLPRYFLNYQKVLRFVTEGLLGAVKTVKTIYYSPPPPKRWYFDATLSGGGVVMDKLPHLLDFFLELFDESPTVEDSRLHHEKGDDVEDVAEIELSFGDATHEISIGWIQPKFFAKHVVIGTNGYLEFNNEQLGGTVGGEDIHFKFGRLPFVDVKIARFYAAQAEDAHARRIESFIDQIVGDSTSEPTVERGYEIASVVESVYERGNG